MVSQKNIYIFFRGLKHLYIYGTGIVAKKYHKFFPECEAYVVSDGQMKETMMNGVKILYLSELQIQDDAGILVCVGEKNQDQIVPLLKEKGWKNYLCV